MTDEVAQLKKTTVTSGSISVMLNPAGEEPVAFEMNKGEEFYYFDLVITEKNISWRKIKTLDGREGFINNSVFSDGAGCAEIL